MVEKLTSKRSEFFIQVTAINKRSLGRLEDIPWKEKLTNIKARLNNHKLKNGGLRKKGIALTSTLPLTKKKKCFVKNQLCQK